MLSVSGLSKIQGGKELFSNGTFQINSGEKVGLVGPNGVGKTSLFRMIIGEDKPDAGQVDFARGTKFSYFSQNVGELSGESALGYVISGNKELHELNQSLRKFEADLGNPDLDPNEMDSILNKMGEVQTKFEQLGGYEIEAKASEILSGLGVTPEDQNKDLGLFSGGWKMRIALAAVLVNMPELIIMDEPTNYLDTETILWLENWLKSFKGSILMTCHDRDFMNSVANKIIEINYGRITTFSGNYDFYEEERDLRREQQLSQAKRQSDMLKKEEAFIAKFAARASHAAQVQSRVKKLEKIDKVEVDPEQDKISILLPEIPRGGNDVVVMNEVSKEFSLPDGSSKKVLSGISTTIKRQDKVALVGVNGAGKSTLLKIITDQIEATSGSVQVGPSINMGYFSQYSFDLLNPENSVFDELKSRLKNKSDGFLRNTLAAFLFRGDEIFKKVKVLSGGEKSRLLLAYLLSTPFNFLVLDEPTNHLDITSREVLLQALQDYQGTIILVSHDRFFVSKLCNKVLFIEKGDAHYFPGSYQEYLLNLQ